MGHIDELMAAGMAAGLGVAMVAVALLLSYAAQVYFGGASFAP
jgi:uncharacterized protein YoaH (UPF0181 family)